MFYPDMFHLSCRTPICKWLLGLFQMTSSPICVSLSRIVPPRKLVGQSPILQESTCRYVGTCYGDLLLLCCCETEIKVAACVEPFCLGQALPDKPCQAWCLLYWIPTFVFPRACSRKDMTPPLYCNSSTPIRVHRTKRNQSLNHALDVYKEQLVPHKSIQLLWAEVTVGPQPSTSSW